MTFDKQSFLAGLHTGLRLGRDPIGRRPPPPSGLYILTEYGRPIITEYSQPQVESDATIYRLGADYRWHDTFMGIEFSNGYLDGGGYFYWQNGSELRMVFYGFNEIYGNAGRIYTLYEEGEEQTRVGFAFLGLDSLAGDVHYQAPGSPFTNYVPDGMVPFEGSEGQMRSWLETSEYDYIITE